MHGANHEKWNWLRINIASVWMMVVQNYNYITQKQNLILKMHPGDLQFILHSYGPGLFLSLSFCLYSSSKLLTLS